MFQRRIPEWLRHAPAPGIRGFAVLAGLDAGARGILISVFPIVMYREFQDAGLVSEFYFFVGIASMTAALMVPWLTRFVPRRWMYTVGGSLYIVSGFLALEGTPATTALALLSYTVAVVTIFVCFNAYILDYVARYDLGRSETQRLFYSALAWTVGPASGILLLKWWPPAPFVLSMVMASILLAVFWWMRLGNGKQIARARAPAPNPVAYLGRFFVQPRLIAGWLFSVIRSCCWWIYVVYLPIFAVENRLGEYLGGTALSISNGLLFITPVMLTWMYRHSVRHAIRIGFLVGGFLFIAAALVADWPWLTVFLLMAATLFLILLDMCAGLPFLMAVKPSERTEMSAIYSTFRDVSGVVSPGVAWLVLLALPLNAVFAAGGAGMLIAWLLASRLHPRLGAQRTVRRAESEPVAASASGSAPPAPPVSEPPRSSCG